MCQTISIHSSLSFITHWLQHQWWSPQLTLPESHMMREKQTLGPKQWDVHPNIDGCGWWSLENHPRTKSHDAEGDFKHQEVEGKAFDLCYLQSNFKIKKKIGQGRVNPAIATTQMSFSSVKLHFLSKGREMVLCNIWEIIPQVTRAT